VIPFSKIKLEIAKILEKAGYVSQVKQETENHGQLRIILKYGKDKSPAITTIKRISKPGCRIYVAAENMPIVLGGLGMAIVTTSRGVMSGKEARKSGVGGELLCEIC
jgi:small subunit ribosomal protein S8